MNASLFVEIDMVMMMLMADSGESELEMPSQGRNCRREALCSNCDIHRSLSVSHARGSY